MQEAWLRLSRADAGGVENLGGWLTTVVARICLNMLRSRAPRREEPLERTPARPVVAARTATDPEHEAVLADSVGLALLVVLDTLTPAERLAFVLHDMFAVPFEEIAAIVERSPRRHPAAGQPGPPPGPGAGARRPAARHRRGSGRWSTAFLAASREGDFDALLAMLDPDIVLRADNAAAQMGADAEAIGPRAVAGIFSGRAKALRPALIDGAPGAVWTYRGETRVVFAFTFTGGTITAIEQIADPERIARFEVTPLKAGLKTQRGQLAGSSGIALARTTLA